MHCQQQHSLTCFSSSFKWLGIQFDFPAIGGVVAFSSLWRVFGECSAVHFLPVL